MADKKEQFTNYRVGEIIGRGRFAIVYEAEKLDIRKKVALKVLNPEFSNRIDIRDQFREQAKQQAKLSHPRLIRVEDLREEHGQFFVAMEYMPLGSLNTWVTQNGMLSFRQAAVIVADIAEALDYLHGRSLVHGDVKPGNILLMEDPSRKSTLRAKLSDLRLPLPVEVLQTVSENLIDLSPEYISPEQAGGLPITPLSDQYSLGVVAYEILGGQPPFSNKGQVDLYIDHQKTQPPSLQKLNEQITPELEQVIFHALEKSAEKRYSSCGEFARALRTAAAATEQKRLENLLSTAEKLLDKKEFGNTREALREALLIQPDSEKANQLTKQLEQQEGLSKNYQQAGVSLKQAEEKALAIRKSVPNYPDDAGLLKTFAPPPPPFWKQIVARWRSAGQLAGFLLFTSLICIASFTAWIDIGSDQFIQPTFVAFDRTSTPTFTPTFTPTLTPTFTPTLTPTFTPTPTNTPIGGSGSGKIAFVSDRDGNDEIYVIDYGNEVLTNLTNDDADDFNPDWSPDGKKITFASNRDGNSEIYVMNAADGSEQLRLTENATDDYSPSWSPDGNNIVFVSEATGDSEIWVMNEDGSNKIRITDNPNDDLSPVWSPDGAHIAFISEFVGGDWELFMMDVDGSNLTKLTSNTDNEGYPIWYSDGRKIAYSVWTPDEDAGIWFINYINGSAELIYPDRVKFDLSPDNKYFVFASNKELLLFEIDAMTEKPLFTISGVSEVSWSP